MAFIFKNKYPNIYDIVNIKIKDINNLNIVVTLTDYNNYTGYISFSELSKNILLQCL